MKVVLQRVLNASVKIHGETVGEIKRGFLLFVGITPSDTQEVIKKVARKCAELRIFEDENGKMNKALKDVNGSILSISQFTLYADCKKGRRPGFDKAARGEIAQPLYDMFNTELASYGILVETGVFGEDMQIELLNDGPVTILLDSAEL